MVGLEKLLHLPNLSIVLTINHMEVHHLGFPVQVVWLVVKTLANLQLTVNNHSTVVTRKFFLQLTSFTANR